LVANGEVHPFEGDLEDYRRYLLSGDAAPAREPEAKATKNTTRRDGAEKRRQLKPLKDKLEAAEHQIAELNIEIAKCEKSLSDPLLFAQDPARGKAVSKKRADSIKKLETLEVRWLKMQEEYELAMAEP
jgi:ATP-binding cassette subfamily F protein 3